MKLRGFRVRWEIDIEAVDATSAARKAWTIQHRSESSATFFEVVEHDGSGPPNWDRATEIDLFDRE